VNGKIIKKKVNVRVEHVRPSTSRKEWIERVKQNEIQKKAVKAGTAGTSSMPSDYTLSFDYDQPARMWKCPS
jgi:hypothetical protein